MSVQAATVIGIRLATSWAQLAFRETVRKAHQETAARALLVRESYVQLADLGRVASARQTGQLTQRRGVTAAGDGAGGVAIGHRRPLSSGLGLPRDGA
ncbi:hypothetical protein [Streptomyces shenzhenensis]|uniref:hypothetical protein n=1 Tax=Streptomyces shenzhenensis TaxID=943815 RepID=UPI0033DDA39B